MKAQSLENGFVLVGECSVTGEQYQTAVVSIEQIEAYSSGILVQDAFPHLSPDDREFIINGISPRGWEIMFGRVKE